MFRASLGTTDRILARTGVNKVIPESTENSLVTSGLPGGEFYRFVQSTANELDRSNKWSRYINCCLSIRCLESIEWFRFTVATRKDRSVISDNTVLTATAVDPIRSSPTVNIIIATVAEQNIISSHSMNHIIARAAVDCVHIA